MVVWDIFGLASETRENGGFGLASETRENGGY